MVEGRSVRPYDRRAVAAWALYDFANSAYAAVIVATIYAAYYALAVVGNERGEGDLWWGRVVSISMATVALTSPVMGAIADHVGLRKRLLFVYTYVSVAATALMATVGPGMVLWGALLAVVGTVGFEGALVFYNAYLPEIAAREWQGRVSAWGFATGYAGSMVGLLAAFPFVRTEAFGGAFLTTAALFGVLAAPAFLVLPADPSRRLRAREAAGVGIRETLSTLRAILAVRELRRFLLAYLVYEDGVNTVIYFSAIFAAQTLGFPMAELIVLYIVVQLSALAGAVLWGKPTDAWGPKAVVMATLVQWILVVTAAYFVATRPQFYAIAIFAGAGLGAIQAASRTFMATLIPRGREAEFFGFYALVGKASAIAGPLVFGGVSHALGGDQRAGILAVGAFFLIGLALLARVKAGGPTMGKPERAPRNVSE